jgi:hypothetical protein
MYLRVSVPVIENIGDTSELDAVLSFESAIHCPLTIKHRYIPHSWKCLVK